MEVKLITHTAKPLETLFAAFRTCYSQDTPIEIWDDINNGDITKAAIKKFINSRLAVGHTSPLEQVTFHFAVSGVSRALSHQLVRHRVGISFEQQSQRYVKFKDGKVEYIMPDTMKAAGLWLEYEDLMGAITRFYTLALNEGVPAEDARFVLPNATPTNFHLMVNFAELLHIADVRLCVRAQWEIRHLVAKMRAEVVQAVPDLGHFLQPKCGEHRQTYCDESLESWKACPLGKVRPHKSGMMQKGLALSDAEFQALEEAE